MAIIVAQSPAAPAVDNKTKKSIGEWAGTLIAVVLALLTAALFGAGQAHRAGYLYQFGFDLSQVPGDFYDTLYWGYVSSTPEAIAWLIAGAVVLLGFGFTLLLGGLAWTQIVRRWPKLRKLSGMFSPKPVAPGTDVMLLGLGMLTVVLMYFVLISYLMMAGAHRAGTEKGRKLLAALAADPVTAATKNDLQWIEIWIDSSPMRIEKGYRFLCTERLCSLYDPTPANRGVRLVSLERLREIRIGEAKQ